jgi:phosphoglycerate kinase
MAAHFKIKGAGFLLQKEIDYLGRLVSDPDRPFVAILGGAKVSDKIGVVKNLMAKMNSLLIGGGMAYTFLKAKGVSVGKSLVEEERVELAREMMAQAEKLSIPLLLPIDHIAADESRQAAIATENDIPPNLAGLDIGEKTRRLFIEEIRKAKTVLWNGPVGLFEEKKFAAGTRAIARALADCAATTIVAGGDTVAAVMEARVEKEITHLSTGGGATLEFLEGRKLPGLVALEESA